MSSPAQSLRAQPTRFDYVGWWLVDHHQLGAMDRSQVTQTVFVKPKTLPDARLRLAAYDLAGEVLSGGLRLPRMQRYIGPIILALGLVLTITGLAMQLVGRGGALQLILGVLLTVGGAVTSAWAPKQMRGNVELARQLNDGTS